MLPDGSANGSVQADASQVPQPVLDRETMLARVEGNREVLGTVVAIFKRNYPDQLRALQLAIQQGNTHQVEELAHTLKSAIGNFSTQACYQSALSLETMGRTASLDNAQSAYNAFVQQVEQLVVALDDELSNR